MLNDGLGWCGIFQRDILRAVVIPITQTIKPEKLINFFEARNLDEQRKCFMELPVEEIKEIIR